MQRVTRLVSVLIFGVVVGCQDESVTRPAFVVTQPASACPTNPSIIVTDDTTLRAALRAARPGDVIAVNGTIHVTQDEVLDDTTGANVVAGVENDGVVDNGSFDCDGDGRLDPNIITGGVVHHQPMPPETLSAPVRKNRGIVIL